MTRAQKIAARAKVRERRLKRRDLVHAAGCASDGCVVRECAFLSPLMVHEARGLGIRIPRSLARRWPRYLPECIEVEVRDA